MGAFRGPHLSQLNSLALRSVRPLDGYDCSARPAVWRPANGYRPKVISGEHRVWMLERIKRDFTLRGLVAELAERGLKVDYRSVWEFVHAGKLSFKKRGGWRTRSPGRRQAASSVAQISRSSRS
jgi:hypothetical protein